MTAGEGESGLYELEVTINGTDENPWRRMGLKANPFPQIARHETDAFEQVVRTLDGDPVRSPKDIRDRLAGCSEEFIQGCIDRWQPGKRTRFTVSFPRTGS